MTNLDDIPLDRPRIGMRPLQTGPHDDQCADRLRLAKGRCLANDDTVSSSFPTSTTADNTTYSGHLESVDTSLSRGVADGGAAVHDDDNHMTAKRRRRQVESYVLQQVGTGHPPAVQQSRGTTITELSERGLQAVCGVQDAPT